MRGLIISADNFEDVELLVPYYRMLEEGIGVEVASINKRKIKGKKGHEVEANKTFLEIDSDNYDILIIPGGKAPEAIRFNIDVIRIVHHFFDMNKPVAAICYGPQVLVSAGVIKGKRATSYQSVVPELKGAGALYEDAEVVVDGNIITSRKPADLPAFMREIMKKLRRKEPVNSTT